jgi:SH3-like domain-containing protein
MSSRYIRVVLSVGMAVNAGSASAFDAMVTVPAQLRTHTSHRATVIEVIPANAVIDMVRCNRGWCEAAYAGQTGHVYTPLIISDEPLAPVPPAPAPVVAAY